MIVVAMMDTQEQASQFLLIVRERLRPGKEEAYRKNDVSLGHQLFRFERQERPAWEMGPDGVLTFLVVDGNDLNAVMKRVKVMPPADTNIDTMLGELRAVGSR